MKIVFKILALYIIVLMTHKAVGQESDTSKMSNLVVYGDGFTFSVKEPVGWTGDIDIAKNYNSNIVFYRSKDDIKKGGALIQVYRFSKQDEKTEKDLEYDIKSYKDEYKNLKQQDFLVSHKDYKCYSKLVYVENDFHQYVVYVNPGPKFRTGISVAMNISKRLATEEELKAFRQLISSLVMLKG